MQVGAELFELADDIGKVGRGEREFGLVIGAWDFHHFGFEFDQGEFEVFVEGGFGDEMQKEFVGRDGVVVLDTDLLSLFTRV